MKRIKYAELVYNNSIALNGILIYLATAVRIYKQNKKI